MDIDSSLDIDIDKSPKMSISLRTESYIQQKSQEWPKTGRHILAHYDDTTIVVYQAFSPEIADYAVDNGKFGGPKYSLTRMTWIKTNFLWMMYRAGWASKRNQERILALHLTREGFEKILRAAKEGHGPPGSHDHGQGPDEVRLQWDPDHSPSGGKMERRAIQLGLRGHILTRFHAEWLVRIEDVTDFVLDQYRFVFNDELDKLVTPRERVFIPSDVAICRHIRLCGFEKEAGDVAELAGATGGSTGNTEAIDRTELADAGACCAELMESQATLTDDVIICLGGAFNPIHTRHVQIMVETKKWLEEVKGFKVVAGVLAVAPEGYVKSKCKKTKQRAIKEGHRLRMAGIACQGYDWLNPNTRSAASAKQGGEFCRQEKSIHNAKIVVIVGADRAVNKGGKAKWHSDKGPMTVCAGRSQETAQMKKAYEEDLANGKVKNPAFMVLPREFDNISSTDIRGKLCFDDDTDAVAKQTAVRDIVDAGWLDANVGEYILQNEDDLYL